MERFCRAINMPEEVTQEMIALDRTLGKYPFLPLLMEKDTWQAGLEQMKEALGEDPQGMKGLCCLLRCAMAARGIYEKRGISEKIYVDTMRAFSRFVREYMESYGCYGFNRETWTPRQVSGKLFRIGQLEYELAAIDGVPAVSLHIPSDADLRPEVLRPSVREGLAELLRIFPEYAGKTVYCQSWLLSPQLKEMLPEGSNILQFQAMFDMEPGGTPNNGVALWVFKNPNLPVEDYPENTSLQRKMKKFLLEGRQFFNGKGYLRL